MSLWSRFLDAMDDPRFCPDCGLPIEVESQPTFHEQTGVPRDRWVWHCPEVYVVVSHNRVTATWHGSSSHIWGQGRPRWHRFAEPLEDVGDGLSP